MKFHGGLPGKTVFHCHRLDHEDNGMMQTIRINDRLPLPPDCPPFLASLRVKAPDWELADVDGNRYASKDFAAKPVLLVLFRGLSCLHCSQQIELLKSKQGELGDLGAQVVLVSSNSEAELRQSLQAYGEQLPFLVLPDPKLEVFRKFGCLGGANESQHGVFVIDRAGDIRWRHISAGALLDPESILAACKQAFTQ